MTDIFIEYGQQFFDKIVKFSIEAVHMSVEYIFYFDCKIAPESWVFNILIFWSLIVTWVSSAGM